MQIECENKLTWALHVRSVSFVGWKVGCLLEVYNNTINLFCCPCLRSTHV